MSSKYTMDLRPAINVIAQVSLSLDEEKGAAVWMIESLDPMSMEPTDDVMQGVLPVNVNGNGQGELAFDIKLKSGMKPYQQPKITNVYFEVKTIICNSIPVGGNGDGRPANGGMQRSNDWRDFEN